jgi:polysaccharide chain length determinant protein (PEP-CTERM system associated)
VNAYKREKGSVIAIDEGKLFEEINIAQQKLYDLELQRRQLEGSRQVTKKSGDPLQAKLVSLQKRLEDLRSEYTDSYPEVIMTKGEIETVREQMKDRKGGVYQSLDPNELAKIDAQIAAIKVSEEGMRRYIATNQALLRNIPSAKAGLDKLELEKNNQKNIYDQLFARHGQSEVSKQMEVQDKSTTFRVVDPAVLPVTPVSPNRLLIMLIGIIGGIAGSFGLLLMLEQMDNSVKGVDFVKGFNVPILAVIPHIHDTLELAAQRRKTIRLFTIAGIYFLFILCFPAMELVGPTYVDKVLSNIHPTALVQGVKEHLR